MFKRIQKYCSGNLKLNVIEEKKFLFDNKLKEFTGLNLSKNSGKLSEWYVAQVLKDKRIQYECQPMIKYGKNKRYLQPDFYIPAKDLFIEVKSRTYNCGGTSSEKIDHVARKYSTKLSLTEKYKNSKVLIVFCAGELFEETTLDLINHRDKNSSLYIKNFVEFTKKYNVLDWIDVNNLDKYI